MSIQTSQQNRRSNGFSKMARLLFLGLFVLAVDTGWASGINHGLSNSVPQASVEPKNSAPKNSEQADSGQPKTEFYDPVEVNIEGWTVQVDPKLLEKENEQAYAKAKKALTNHLQRIEFILPAKPLARIKQCRIWLEMDNPLIKGMQYHPGRGWLLSKKLDPRLVKHVHIPQAAALTDPSQWAKHPYVILHELAHSYHDQVLGFDDDKIRDLYRKAKESGLYDEIMDHRGRKLKHYAMTTPMEYFAESTEAYLGVNDFYPFVRAELKAHDPAMFNLLEEIWGKIR